MNTNSLPAQAPDAPVFSATEEKIRNLVEQFSDALRRGEMPDPFEWLLVHPELAAQLEPRLVQVQQLYEQLRPLVTAPSRPAETAAAALRLPGCVGRYRIDGLLGQGNQAIVFRAYDPKFERPVALKVLHPNLAAASGYLQRFHQAAKVVAKLRHPNIVELHDAGQEAGFHYIDMFLVEGETLQQHLERRAGSLLSFDVSAELIYKLAQALHHAHEQGVVHRDLKPANILLPAVRIRGQDPLNSGVLSPYSDGFGEPQLTDFGLARDLDVEATQSQPGAIVGTLAYMAPEQAAGHSHAADARSDVYSLGAVLYELLTDRWPFHDSATFAALIYRKSHEDPAPSRQLNSKAPRDLDTICMKALERDPADRFATAQAMAEELWRWRHDEPIKSRPPTRPERVRRWARRNRAAAVLTVVLAAVVLTAAAVFGWMHVQRTIEARLRGRLFEELELRSAWQELQVPTQGRRERAFKKLREVIETRRRDDRPLVDAPIRTLYAAALAVPDVKEVAAVQFKNDPFLLLRASLHPDGAEMVIGTAAGPVRWKLGDELHLTDDMLAVKPPPRVRHSQDGKHLAYAPAGGGLLLHAAADMERPLRTQPEAGVILGLGFDRAGAALWTVSGDGKVAQWSIPDLRLNRSWDVPAGNAKLTAAAVSDDTAAVAIGDAAGRVVLHQSDDRLIGEVDALGFDVEALAWSPDGKQVAIGVRDGTVHLAGRDGRVRRSFNLLSYGVGSLLFSPDGQWLIAGQRGARTRIWDTLTGAQVLSAEIVPWGFARDGLRFAGTLVGKVAFGEIERPVGAYYLRGHQVHIEQLAWSRDGRRLASLDTRGEIRVWDFLRETSVDELRGAAAGFFGSNSGLALSDDGALLAYANGGRASELLVREVSAKRTLGPWPLPAGFDRLACPGGAKFVSVREEEEAPGSGRWQTAARDLDARGPGPLRVLRPHVAGERGFYTSRLSWDGRRYFWLGPRTPARANRAEVYDVGTGKLIFQSELPHAEPQHSIAGHLSGDGRFLWLPDPAEPSRGRTHDLTGRPPQSMPDHFEMSPDQRWHVVSCEDPLRKVQSRGLKSAADNRLWLILLTTPVFNPDGRHLALDLPGGMIVVLDIETLKERLDAFEREETAH